MSEDVASRFAATWRESKARLRESGFRPRRNLGQNFLTDGRVAARILEAAAAEGKWRTLEIGTGPGTLTRVLADLPGDVVTFEIDPRIAEVAAEALSGLESVHQILGDCLAGKHRLAEPLLEAIREGAARYEGRVRVVANLPYSIAAPLILGLLEAEICPRRLIVMVQREVAERLMAAPGGKEYGALSVLCQWLALVERVVEVPPDRFWPAPEVRSTVLRLEPRSGGADDRAHYRAYKSMVQSGFRQRRKMLTSVWRGLSSVGASLEALGKDARARIESLTPEEQWTLCASVASANPGGATQKTP